MFQYNKLTSYRAVNLVLVVRESSHNNSISWIGSDVHVHSVVCLQLVLGPVVRHESTVHLILIFPLLPPRLEVRYMYKTLELIPMPCFNDIDINPNDSMYMTLGLIPKIKNQKIKNQKIKRTKIKR